LAAAERLSLVAKAEQQYSEKEQNHRDKADDDRQPQCRIHA
jgi:hypothetical protein